MRWTKLKDHHRAESACLHSAQLELRVGLGLKTRKNDLEFKSIDYPGLLVQVMSTRVGQPEP